MGESELKRALQREGEEQICNFWQQAETVVALRRKEIKAELMQLRHETDRQLQGEATELRNNLLFEAQTRAMGCRLHEEAALEERLLHLARQLLPELASNGRAVLWKKLCEELPESDWMTIKVHPADQTLADQDFPAARIESDETLGGGLIVTNAEGTIRIDNSLNCRLLRAWPDLVPKLLGEFHKRVDNDETARTDKAG
jgi:vacuolar-type H+-ATPase subunit E/Vma4